MPGAVPRTSTYALAGATLPYIVRMANLGVNNALCADRGFLAGLNTFNGMVTCKAVAEALDLQCIDAAKALADLPKRQDMY